MSFDHLIGNEPIKRYLTKIAASNTASNSILFTGQEGIGKSLFAEAFATQLICAYDPEGIHANKLKKGTHPDLRIFRPEGKTGMHSMAAMKQFNDEVFQSPYEATRKVLIIQDAERMLPYSANALLKTFEEPLVQNVIILISSAPNFLLQTILSRCHKIQFHPIKDDEITAYIQAISPRDPEEIKRIVRMAQGSIGNALKIIQEGENPLREILLKILSQSHFPNYRSLLDASSEIAGHIEETKKQKEEAIRQSFREEAVEMTALQKQTVEKEIEGMVALKLNEEMHHLFEVILGWYRDMHLLHVNGSREYLYHPDYCEEAGHVLQQGGLLSLEEVLKAVSETKLAVERFTGLSSCFENLFLRLNLLKT